MTPLAALVLGSSLTAMTGGAGAPSEGQPVVAPSRRSERSRQRREAVNTVVAIGLEVGATLFYIGAADSIRSDLQLTSAGCNAPDQPCRLGTPVALLIPVSGMVMGAAGAARIAAAREANIWRSGLFWVGTATEVVAFGVSLAGTNQDTRNQRVARDTTLVAGAIVGTTLQIWGAMIAPPRETKLASRSLHLAPGCGPTSGGVVCGLAMAGF
jgi:hypothetical protein